MATRGRPKSDQKRQQILEAAGDLFTRQGYEATNLEQVAASAGVSKQTIYNNFPCKADLLREGIKQRCEESRITAEGLDYELPPGQFLREYAKRFIDMLTEEKPLRMYRLCVSESERHPEVGVSFFESGPLPVVEAFSEYLRRATERGELAVTQPHLAATQFLFMIRGLPIECSMLCLPDGLPWDFDLDDYVEASCAMFERAYCVDSSVKPIRGVRPQTVASARKY